MAQIPARRQALLHFALPCVTDARAVLFRCESAGESQRVALGASRDLQVRDAGAGADLRDRRRCWSTSSAIMPRTGRQCRLSAGHPEVFAGHAGHPLGLRLSHRRLLRDRPEPRRRDFSRRRRLRYQLRCAPDAHQPQAGRSRPADSRSRRPTVPRHPVRAGARQRFAFVATPTNANAPTQGAHWAVEHGFGEAGGPGLHRRTRADWPMPNRRTSPTARWNAAKASSARSAAAIIFSKCRSWTKSFTRTPPR